MGDKPPLNVTDNSFDVIFAWSIFSHYSKAFHRAWLAELHRILRARGRLLVTVQSDYLLNQMRSKDMISETRSENVDLEALSKEYHDSGYGFYRCYPETEENYGFDVENFGMAFISWDYIRRNWTELFEITCIDPGATGSQDIVLLRKS
jgi:Methyltransferase domain